MADQRQILTDKGIARLPYAPEKQYKMRDTELPGFFVLIGKRKKSFMAQGEFWRDGVREFAVQVKLGKFGDLSTREARSKAKEALGSIARGQRPGEGSRAIAGSVTLRQAWERYRDAHMRRKGRNAGTIENYRDHMDNRIAAECRNTCIVTDFCVSDGQMPSAICTYLASLNQSSHRRFYAASFAAITASQAGLRTEVGIIRKSA